MKREVMLVEVVAAQEAERRLHRVILAAGAYATGEETVLGAVQQADRLLAALDATPEAR